MRKALITATALIAGLLSATVGEASAQPAVPTAPQVGVTFFRWVCATGGASVRDFPGGNQIAFLGYGSGVNVDNPYDGVWFHINQPVSGFILAERLCS